MKRCTVKGCKALKLRIEAEKKYYGEFAYKREKNRKKRQSGIEIIK